VVIMKVILNYTSKAKMLIANTFLNHTHKFDLFIINLLEDIFALSHIDKKTLTCIMYNV